MIIERPRRRGYQLHAEDSPEAEALLIERGLKLEFRRRIEQFQHNTLVFQLCRRVCDCL